MTNRRHGDCTPATLRPPRSTISIRLDERHTTRTSNGTVFAVSDAMYDDANRTLQRLGAPILWLTAAILCCTMPAVAQQSLSKTGNLCASAIHKEERRSRIPSHLMDAIASVESGRWDPMEKANIAWPWTVTAEGKGKFYPTRQAAVHAVESLHRRGIRNIDVGCMQINLGYHPNAFQSLEQAFDPRANVAYAATFLKQLYADRRSWVKAVRYYHSSHPDRQRRYGSKVFKARQEIRARETQRRRDKRIALASEQRSTSRVDHGERRVSGIPLSHWPPRGYRAQRQLELRARNWAFSARHR